MASSTTLSGTPASRALWSERQPSASLVTSSPTTTALNRSSPISGPRCWPTPTSTSSLCCRGSNPTRSFEWQPIPCMSGKWHSTSSRGSGPTSLRRCTQKGIATSVSPATTRQPRDRHGMGLSQPSGATGARASTCRWNTRPTSPGPITKQQKRTSLPAPRRATMTPYPDTGSPTSPAAGAAAKQRERSGSSVPEPPPPRLHPDPSPGQRDESPWGSGSDLSQLPLLWRQTCSGDRRRSRPSPEQAWIPREDFEGLPRGNELKGRRGPPPRNRKQRGPGPRSRRGWDSGRRGSVCVPRRGWSSSLSCFRQAWSPDRGYRVVARKDGTEDGLPRLYLEWGLHSAPPPPHTGNLPRLARGPGRPGRLLRRPGATASDRLRNATWLAPRARRLLGRGRGRLQGQRPSSPGPEKRIRLRLDRVQCREVRKALLGWLGWGRFVEAWKPGDLILTSRQKVRSRVQRLLFERHEKNFSDTFVPLLYRPKDSRRQNIMVQIPGPGVPDRQELILNDVVDVPLKYVSEALDGKGEPALGSWLCHHSPLGLRSHRRRSPEGLDHRWLPPVVKSRLLGCLKGKVYAPAREGSLSPEEGSEGARTLTSSSSAKPSRGSWWPTSDRTRPRGWGLASASITS